MNIIIGEMLLIVDCMTWAALITPVVVTSSLQEGGAQGNRPADGHSG